jgi:hypothetical protein
MATRLQSILIWVSLLAALIVPIVAAAMSPLLAWRDPIYILAGFAGIFAMGLLLVQPMLAGGFLPGLSALRSRRLHGLIGALMVAAVIVHVAGLWITSPPDVIDALMLSSPTSFSIWGVTAMWAIFLTAAVARLRRRLRMRPRIWRAVHVGLAVVIAVGTVAHALLIEGTMEEITKVLLCLLVLIAVAKVAADLTGVSRRR